MYLIDIPTSGSVMKLRATAELTVYEDYFTMEIRGDVGVGFQDKRETNFNKSVINGSGYVAFSSKDLSFVGNFQVNLNTRPIVCASGELGFEINPEYWEVYVGKEANPLTVEILCIDFLKVDFWLHISKYFLDVGIRAHFEAFARSPWFKVFGTEVRPYAGFMLHFEIATRLAFQPQLKLEKAKFHLEIFAGVGAEWRKKNKSGVWNLAAVYFKGLAEYENTSAAAYVRGELAGRVEIIGIKIGVNLKLEKDLKGV